MVLKLRRYSLVLVSLICGVVSTKADPANLEPSSRWKDPVLQDGCAKGVNRRCLFQKFTGNAARNIAMPVLQSNLAYPKLTPHISSTSNKRYHLPNVNLPNSVNVNQPLNEFENSFHTVYHKYHNISYHRDDVTTKHIKPLENRRQNVRQINNGFQNNNEVPNRQRSMDMINGENSRAAEMLRDYFFVDGQFVREDGLVTRGKSTEDDNNIPLKVNRYDFIDGQHILEQEDNANIPTIEPVVSDDKVVTENAQNIPDVNTQTMPELPTQQLPTPQIPSPQIPSPQIPIPPPINNNNNYNDKKPVYATFIFCGRPYFAYIPQHFHQLPINNYNIQPQPENYFPVHVFYN